MSWDDDEVGYGKPPRWTRFTKGQSGNPKGRPRRQKPAPDRAPSNQDDIARRVLQKPVSITEGGKKRKITYNEYIQHSQANSAAKGNVIAQRDILRTARELEARDIERAKEAAEIEQKVFRYVLNWRASQAAAWQAAAANGREPETPWPHPDDILIDTEQQRWGIRGPDSADSVYVWEAIRAQRDLVQMHSIVQISRGRPGLPLAKACALVFLKLDLTLPKRWQKGIDGWQQDAEVFLGYPRQLLNAALASVERYAAAKPLPALSPEHRREVQRATNRAMQPILRRMGYRSLKQFEAAYAELGNDMPWPRVVR